MGDAEGRGPHGPGSKYLMRAIGRRDSDGEGGEGGADVPPTSARTVTAGVAAVMLVAEMAGSGVLALPRALANTGWGGLLLIMFLGVSVGFSGTRLGLCWVILEEKFPPYRKACRTPYPTIGFHALGPSGRALVVVAQNVTLVGVTTVFLILSGDLLQALLGPYEPVVLGSHCWCTLLTGAVLLPLSWLGTPKDFWPSAVVAMATTMLAVVVVVVQLGFQKDQYKDADYSTPSFNTFFLGFGTILFSFGGAATFPTIQNDMKDRSRFPSSVGTAFTALLAMYLPLSAVGYGIVGAGVPGNILRSVDGVAVQLTQGLVVMHLWTAYVILVNPVTQGLEEIFRIPRKFGWKRCVLRSAVVVFEVLIGLAIPDFGKILDLVGGSTVALMSFILPPVCYLRLSDEIDDNNEPAREVPYYERTLLYIVLVTGVLGGITATWSAVTNLGAESKDGPSSCFFWDSHVPALNDSLISALNASAV